MMRILFLLLFSLSVLGLQAQAQNDSNISPGMNQRLNYAKELMAQEKYQEANAVFREMLNSGQVLPDDLAYLFAETLYMLGQYQNSRNFLIKYLQVAGKNGNYYKQATELDALLEEKLHENEYCAFCNHEGYRFITCTHCEGSGQVIDHCSHCKGSKIINCQTCYGEGVQIYTDNFGKRKYKTCPTCKGNGTHDCPVCLGVGEVERYCPVCSGTGKEASAIVCDHKALK